MMQSGRPATPARILLAEDDFEMRRVLIAALRQDNYDIVELDSGSALLEEVSQARDRAELPALIVSDVRMPGMSGLRVVEAIRRWGLRMPIILITAFGSEETLNEAFQLGATAVLSKPFDLEDLRSAVLCLLPNGAGNPQTDGSGNGLDS
jgi:CheY-like chemotaxis protein